MIEWCQFVFVFLVGQLGSQRLFDDLEVFKLLEGVIQGSNKMEDNIVAINGLIGICHHWLVIFISGHEGQDDISRVMSILLDSLKTIFLYEKFSHDLPTLRMWRL